MLFARTVKISVCTVLWLLCSLTRASEFVGSKQCQSCHQDIVSEWQHSDHFRSMQKADSSTVLGDFNNQVVNFHGIESHLFRRGEDFYINTVDVIGVPKDFKILYTFGFDPLQQYLVATEKGRFQALNIAWDARPAESGGQRWFHLQPDETITPEHPFFWASHFANWNSRCAACHSTNLKEGYQAQSMAYQTTFSEMNVACESCHGPAQQHLLAVADAAEKGTGYKSPQSPAVWSFTKGSAIASANGAPQMHEIDMCGGCHSRRRPINADNSEHFFEQFSLETLGSGLYFADGQIEDEVFVLGSFLQSKMHQAGVTCSNCHNPHSGKVKASDNQLCSQCHAPQAFDVVEHHNHEIGSEGALCVNCHMPARTYMQVDDRRDHRFVVPNQIQAKNGAPSPCLNCHQDQTDDWMANTLTVWGVNESTDHWSLANHLVRSQDFESVPLLVRHILDDKHPDIVRATLLEQLGNFPSPNAQAVSTGLLRDTSAVVRRAAVVSLESTATSTRWELLSPMLEDPDKSVRLETLRVLSPVLLDLSSKQQRALTSHLEEYRSTLRLQQDTPGGQMALAILEFNLDNRGAAAAAYQRALDVAPGYVPALINFADFHRGSGQDSKAKSLLLRALKVAPDSAAVNHSYGLHLVRAGQYTQSLAYLEKGALLEDSEPRYSYVYAVALDSLDRTGAAVRFLQQANNTWPNQYDLLLTLVLYLDKLGQASDIEKPLAKLQSLAPSSPDVQFLLRKYPANSPR